jgi:WD40 repeat protein
MNIVPLPPQIVPIQLSRRAIREAAGEALLPSKPSNPLKELGTTYSMAQEVRWLDSSRFAIGRWDGTLTIFHLPTSPTGGPVISTAAVSSAFTGVEMITSISPTLFISSIDSKSIAVWEKNSIAQCSGIPFHKVTYDPGVGVANSGAIVTLTGKPYLATGHAEGVVLVWQISHSRPYLRLVHTILVRSPDPVPSPYRLWNVREIQQVADGLAATGSEDGDICLISIAAGKVVLRMRYNPGAQRGINDISYLDDYLLVANCSVGNTDNNLWLYRIHGSSITLTDSKNLKTLPAAPQCFNFTVEMTRQDAVIRYFSATEEGLLWVGQIQGDKIGDGVTVPVSSHFGAALNFEPSQRLLAVVGDNIHLYQLT